LFLQDPMYLFRVWEGGMSFHGGLLGVIAAMFWFAHRTRTHFFQVADFMAPLIPFGLGMGRLGNFINGELWGRVTDFRWAMMFPSADIADKEYLLNHPEWLSFYEQYHMLPRHASQLYEMVLEGVVLFIILNLFIRRPRPMGAVSGLFLFFYGCFRYLVEFCREPDEQLGLFLHGAISMGQMLSLPMVIIGALIIYWSYHRVKTR
ncbi:MAG: prolipoprotein diacylglyceryl transferase, partial [Enterobacteriaceae bacterium]